MGDSKQIRKKLMNDNIDEKIEALLNDDEMEKLWEEWERRQKLKKKEGLYEDDIRKILEDKVLKHFDAYIFTDVFDVLAYKEDWLGQPTVFGFEIKSDRDQPIRIFEQLPQYVYICDVVYLVLGERVSAPPNLPSWVGILKIVGEDVKVVKHGGARIDHLMKGLPFDVYETNVCKKFGCSLRGKMMHYMTKKVLPNYEKHTENLPSPDFFYNFLKKWFILSAFRNFKDKIKLKFDTVEILMLETLANYFKTGARQMSLVEFEEGSSDD